MSRSPSSAPPTRPVLRAGIPIVLLVFAACGGSTGPTEPGGGATFSGTVRAAGSASALADATVTIGSHTTTTDASGHFELTGLATGTVTARAVRPGYSASDAALTLSAGSNSHDFALTPQEVYLTGTGNAYAVYLPAEVGAIRGVIIALGGPTTDGFVTGGPLTNGQPNEERLQLIGQRLRALARLAHVAILGTRNLALANSAVSDNEILAALRSVAQASGHAELEAAPLAIFGGSSGGPEAAGLASRVPARTIGLLEWVPVGVSTLTAAATLAIPTFVMQAELDDATRNASVKAAFATNRSQGGLWALEVEPGAEHSTVSDLGINAAIGWLSNVLLLRLPAHSGDPLVVLGETTGWLGDQSTLEIAAWADYAGNPITASWLLGQADAVTWKSLGGGGGSGGGTLRAR